MKVSKEKFAAGDFITSTKGQTMLLDLSANGGPGEKSFQHAIDWFCANYPAPKKDPTNWTAQEREHNEEIIVKRYAATRKVAAPVGETRAKRNAALSKL